MRFTTRLLCLTVLATAATAQAADVWRWVDAKGTVHYSDLPIDGAVRVKRGVIVPPGNSSSAGGAVTTNAPSWPPPLPGAARADEQLAQGAATRSVQADLAKKRAEQCKAATQSYEQTIAARRLYKAGAKGERVYLTDAELTQTRVQARQDRDAVCAPLPR